MKRSIWLAAAMCLMMGLGATAAKKNVVLIVTDDQGVDSLGCYGNPVIKTPNMDALAADGTRFQWAFATTASCSASRSVILTGLHNHANGQYGHTHHYHKFSTYDNIVSLPVYLAAAGYRTARIGKYHVAPEEVYHFDVALKGNSRHPVQMADNSKDFINEASDKPFFLYFCTSDPHRGNGVVKDHPLKPDSFGNNGNYPGIKTVEYDEKDVIVPGFLPDTPECRAELAQYYQSVSRIDQGLGRLIGYLKEAGVYDDTLIIYISDHGIAMPGAKTTVYDGGLRAPCLVRNPYLDKRGVVSEAMVSWVDLTPTILDFAGALDEDGSVKSEIMKQIDKPRVTNQNTRDTKPGRFHGRSFLSILDKTQAMGWDHINASHTFHEIQMYYPMRVVRDQKFKLIWNIAHELPYPFASDLWRAATWQAQYAKGMDAPYGKTTVGRYIHRPEFELFDIQKDPYEGNNLSGDADYTSVLENMKAQLKAFQKRTDDPWTMKWNYE
ncbi:sulfatase [Planctomycetales bacterium ZRK34]|nr:sulfatase [Planctomycetales bacterium ZRK34]